MYSDQSPVYDQQQLQQMQLLQQMQIQQQQHGGQQQQYHDPNMQMNSMDLQNMAHQGSNLQNGNFDLLHNQQQMLAQQQAYYNQQMGNLDPSGMANRTITSAPGQKKKASGKKKTAAAKSKESKAAVKAKVAKANAAAKAKIKKQKDAAKLKEAKKKALDKEKKKKALDKEKKKKLKDKEKLKKEKDKLKIKKEKEKEKAKAKAKKEKAKKITKKELREKERAQRAAADGKKRRRSMKKNPDAPKRGKSAYILFSIERREIVKEQLGPDAKVQEIMKQVALDWRQLPEEEKKPWVEKSVQDKARYDQELANYSGPLKIPNKRPKRLAGAPKRGMSAFLMFSQVVRPQLRDEMPDKRNIEISKMLGERWKALSDEDKKPWVQKADEDATRYNEEKLKWDNYTNEERKAISDKVLEEEREKQRLKEEQKAKEKAAQEANGTSSNTAKDGAGL